MDKDLSIEWFLIGLYLQFEFKYGYNDQTDHQTLQQQQAIFSLLNLIPSTNRKVGSEYSQRSMQICIQIDQLVVWSLSGEEETLIADEEHQKNVVPMEKDFDELLKK